MFLADFDDGFRNAQRGDGIAAEYLEERLEVVGVGQRRRMSGFDRTHDRVLNQRPRPSDLAKLPTCVGEVDRRTTPKSMPKWNLVSRSRSGSYILSAA